VTAAQIPLTSIEDDVAITKRLLAAQNGPTVLVGHSYGGIVVSGAGTGSPNVKALVYIAAFGLDEGESIEGKHRGKTSLGQFLLALLRFAQTQMDFFGSTAKGSRRLLLPTSSRFKRASWLRCKSRSASFPLPAKRARPPGKIFRPGTWLRRKTR
jgi:pimeloyl-ACP methyl ester carboxylesterase